FDTKGNLYISAIQLGGTLVAMGGRALPLVEVADDHVSAIIPYDLPVNTRTQLIVQRGTSAAVPEDVTMAPAQPAIFTVAQTGSGQGQIFKSVAGNAATLADSANPATAGDTIIVQCTGLGAVDSSIPAGTAAPDAPLARVTAPVSLTIGGVKADVQIAAL